MKSSTSLGERNVVGPTALNSGKGRLWIYLKPSFFLIKVRHINTKDKRDLLVAILI